MDCLDRTNVVQSVFARQISHIQLNLMNLQPSPKGKPFEEFKEKELELAFRNIWTDNADALSTLYTGTPALKTDFTRTGKRSTKGAIDDGINSLTRYYINNFTDGYNHDCLDLSQGKLKPEIKMNDRGPISMLKIAFVMLFGAIYATSMALASYFPIPNYQPNDSLWFF